MADNTKTADMQAPTYSILIAVFCIIIGLTCVINNLASKNFFMMTIGLVPVTIGIGLFLVWKNVRLFLLPSNKFEYVDLFGKHSQYSFNEITAITKSKSGYVLYIDNKKILVFNPISTDLRQTLIEQLKRFGS